MRGRPSKSSEEKRTERLITFLTSEENEQVNQIAANNNITRSSVGYEGVKRVLSLFGKGEGHMYSQRSSGADLTGPLNGAHVIHDALHFDCSWSADTWGGVVRLIRRHESHVEFVVEARGTANTVIAGNYSSGVFMSFPSEGVSLALGEPLDVFYNKEAALKNPQLNRIDGVTAVYALKALFQAGYFPN